MLRHAYNPIAASGGMEWWTEYIAELILQTQKAQGADDPKRSFHMAMEFIKAGGRHIGETYKGRCGRCGFKRIVVPCPIRATTAGQELSGVKGSSVAIAVGGSMRTQHARDALLRGLDLDPIYVEASGLHALSWYGKPPGLI